MSGQPQVCPLVRRQFGPPTDPARLASFYNPFHSNPSVLPMTRRFYIVTLGCPKNSVDAEAMTGLLLAAGWRQTQRADRADVLIANTCGFIEAARQESLDTLRQLAQTKGQGQKLLAAGCLSQRWGPELQAQVPGVDGILGTREWARVVSCVDELFAPSVQAPVRLSERLSVVTPMRRLRSGHSAYLKISDGCSAACAFCAIPQIKGPHRSKDRQAILTEARELAKAEVREIVLIGQDTTAYGQDLGEHDALPSLIEDICQAAPEVPWLRLMYAYPQHVSPRLVELLATKPQLCHYLDLPLQHAHPDTLRRMRRPSDIDLVRRLIEQLRGAMPDIALRTTFIVGFPGETEAEFEALLEFFRWATFDRVGVFVFSREEGTAAATLPNQVPAEVAQERFQRAMELQRSISLQRNQLQVGRTLPVLVEGYGDGVSLSRSYRDAPEIDGYVLLTGKHAVGTMVQARIVSALDYDLVAETTEPD